MSDHPVFEAPEDADIKIWRYMDFTKFVSILDSKALFFSRADLLGDPYEGATSHFNSKMRPEVYKDKIPEQALKQTAAFSEWLRQWTFVSCWHMNEVESAAMWNLYAKTNEAVAIQSTYSLLKKSVPENTYLGVVKYINYENDWLPEGNSFYLFVHKRLSFAHERELRVVISNPPTKGNEFDYQKNLEGGVLLPVDISSLIQQVYVAPTSPDWFRNLVGSIIAKYDFSFNVATSSIDKPPTF